MSRKIIFVVNVDWFFVSHRLPLAQEAIKRGWKVFIVTKDTGHFFNLRSLGLECINLEFNRSGKNPINEIRIFLKLRNIYNKIQADIIHHITLKPAIYGTIASKQIKSNSKIFNAVSGLGYSFTDNRKSLSKTILIQLLKFAFNDKSASFIFQNPDDKKLFSDFNFLSNLNYKIIKGAGVDESVFCYTPPTEKKILQVVFLARMLKDKGIMELLSAANLLKENYSHKVKFILCGSIDLENPAHISEEELIEKCDGDYIVWVGHTTNVKDVYIDSDIVCLPSYREGLPKSLVEAMAIGRPIITTNAIGCKECVDDKINGFLVPVKSIYELANAIEELINNNELRFQMGIKSRYKMEKEMSLSHVINETFKFYD